MFDTITLPIVNPTLAYHITPTRNLPNILTYGLEAKRGRRSKNARERGQAVYLFHDVSALAYGLDRWLDNMFSKKTLLGLLAVDMSEEIFEIKGIEIRCPFELPSKKLTILSTNITTFSWDSFFEKVANL
jgi:hypothetical protein